MKHIFRFLAITSILAGSVVVRAQSLARFTFPANNATNVPIADSVVITTHWKIDSSSLISPTVAPGDTVTIGNVTPFNNVLVISQFDRDSLTDSAWGSMSAALQCNILNDTTLSVSLAPLSPGMQYLLK